MGSGEERSNQCVVDWAANMKVVWGGDHTRVRGQAKDRKMDTVITGSAIRRRMMVGEMVLRDKSGG